MEGHFMNIDGTFDVAAEKYHPRLLGKWDSVSQPVCCASLICMLVRPVASMLVSSAAVCPAAWHSSSALDAKVAVRQHDCQRIATTACAPIVVRSAQGMRIMFPASNLASLVERLVHRCWAPSRSLLPETRPAMAMPRRVLGVREFPAYRASWHMTALVYDTAKLF